MKHGRLLGTAAIAATAAGALLTTSVAHASPGLHFSGRAASSARNNTSSGAQAGYEVTPTPTTASAGAHWTVPTVTCTTTGEGMAPGTFLFESSNGAPVGVTVLIDCSSGSPTYTAYFIGPSGVVASTVAVSAGDSLQSSVTQSANATTGTLKDTTTKTHQSFSDTGGTPGYAFLGIDTLFNGTNTIPVPTFTNDPFSHALMDGMTPAAAGATALDLSINPPKINIKTSGLNTAGNKFKEVFKHN